MDVQQFLTETASRAIPLGEITAIAADRVAFGDDVIAGFATQVQHRALAAERVLRDAETAGRDNLLASEQRAYDAAIRERDSILALQQSIERRTAQRAHVPPTQTTPPPAQGDAIGATLTREQRCADWVRGRGGRAADPAAQAMRFGAVVRALALGERTGLSDLELRALSEGSDSSGGYTVPEVLAGAFIDRVRNNMVVMRAGALTVPMTSDTLHLARVGQPDSVSPNIDTAAWKVENEDTTETDLTLERVTFTARTLPVLIKLSVELSEDSVNVDQMIERELSAQLALELDRAALVGSGVAPIPRGVRNQSGVGVTSFNDATPADFDFIVDAVGRLWALNHEPNAVLYNANLATAIAKLKEGGTSKQPLRMPDALAAVPRFRTNQIPTDVASPATTSLFAGDFTQLMIGLRTSFRMEISRVSGDAFTKLQVWVRAYLRADVQVAHPEAFDITTDIAV